MKMAMKGLNLERALQREKRRAERKDPDQVLEAFIEMLRDDDQQDDLILQRIFGRNSGIDDLDAVRLDPERIYHIDHIKKLCTDYRLRFLDGEFFKGEIPYEAISRVKTLQRNQDKEIHNYKIMAPAPMFHLEEKDRDPLLFVPLSGTHYYLVHQWGKDLHPLRRMMVFPFRNFKSLLATVALFAFAVVMSVPSSVMMGPYDTSSLGIRVIFFFYLFIAFSGLTTLYGFSRMKNFNANLWNSKYTS
jgi:hypothetical protein